MFQYPSIQKATDIGIRGISEDKKNNYASAVMLYEQCEGCLIDAIRHEAPTDEIKDVLGEMLQKYQTRIMHLKSKLSKKNSSHLRSQSRLHFQSKHQRSLDQSSSKNRLCDYSQLNDRLKNLDLCNDTEKKNCE